MLKQQSGEKWVNGRLVYIDDVNNVKENFKTRSFGVIVETEFNGEVQENYIGFQVLNAKCSMLDGLQIGQNVRVSYALKGAIKEYPDKIGTVQNPKSAKCITNVNAWKIVPVDEEGEVIAVGSVPKPAPNHAPAPEVKTEDEEAPF